MNKYTLTFKDQQLETLYQANQSRIVRYPTLIIISILFTIQAIVVLITRVLNNGPLTEIFIIIGTIVYQIITIVIVRKYQHLSQGLLATLSIYIYLFHSLVQHSEQHHVIYLLGQNVSILMSVMVFLIDFKLTFLTRIVALIIRLAYALSQEELPVEGYTLTLMSFVTLIICAYQNNYSSRLQYLLKLKDSQWENVLPTLVENEFYIFVVNIQGMRFDLRLSNKGSNENTEFKEFIRQATTGNSTLEQYIYFNHQQQSLQLFTLQNPKFLTVSYKKRQVGIKIYAYYTSELNYAIVVENEVTKQIKQEYKLINQQQLSHFNSFIGKISKKIQQQINRQPNNYSLGQIQVLLYEFSTFITLNREDVKYSMNNVGQKIFQCLKLFPKLRFNHNIVINCKPNITFTTAKPLFVLLVIKMINYSLKFPLIINVTKLENIEIQFIGRFNDALLNQDKLFNIAVKKLCISYNFVHNGYYFTFPNSLETSFSSVTRTY